MLQVFPAEFEEKKKRIKVLILGPYRPPDAEKRLQEFKECLQHRKYENAKKVSDFPDEPRYHEDWDVHCTMKSQYLIKNWGDILIFVFFKEADNQGVAIELEFTCQKAKEKTNYSVVLHEQGTQLSSLTKGPIKMQKMDSYDFKNGVELCNKAFGYCTKSVYRLFWEL